MLWEVAHPAAVGFGWLAGDAEIADERLALSHLLIFQLEDFADPLQREGQPHVRAPYQGAAPGGRVKVISDSVLLYAVRGKILRIVSAQYSADIFGIEGLAWKSRVVPQDRLSHCVGDTYTAGDF